jgi:hypothetical protein
MNFTLRPRTAALCLACFMCACTIGPKVQDGGIITTNAQVQGYPMTVRFTRGADFSNIKKFLFARITITPQMAVWAEDTQGRYLQTLYVTRKFAKQDWGIVPHSKDSCFRTSSLPYWLNKYVHAGNSAPTVARPLPDAVTSATPTGCFDLVTTLLPVAPPVVICAEVNSSFDYSQAFGPGRRESKINGQPAVVYKARVGENPRLYPVVSMKLSGHSGETGTDSLLYPDVSGITTAKNIFSCINVLVTPAVFGAGDSAERTGATPRAAP